MHMMNKDPAYHPALSSPTSRKVDLGNLVDEPLKFPNIHPLPTSLSFATPVPLIPETHHLYYIRPHTRILSDLFVARANLFARSTSIPVGTGLSKRSSLFGLLHLRRPTIDMAPLESKNTNTVPPVESKSSKKKKAKAEVAESQLPPALAESETGARRDSADGAVNGVDGSHESPYIKELQKYA